MTNKDRTAYERQGNVLKVQFGHGPLPKITSQEKLARILSGLIAEDVDDISAATTEVRSTLEIVLAQVGTTPAPRSVQRSLLESIIARLVREKALKNTTSTRLPRTWESLSDLAGVREKVHALRSDTKRHYRTALADLANPASAALNTRLFVDARRALDTDWNMMRTEIMAKPVFTRVIAYLGPEYADVLLPDPAIDLPDSETLVINEFYNALTLFAHLASLVPNPKQHPDIYHLLVNTKERLLKIYADIRRDIMSYDASRDRSRGATNVGVSRKLATIRPIINLLQEPLSKLLGITEGGGVLLTNFSNDRTATAEVQAVKSLHTTSFSQRRDHILSQLEAIATEIEQKGLPRTVLFQQFLSRPEELQPALAETMADYLKIEAAARSKFLARMQKALAPKAVNKKA